MMNPTLADLILETKARNEYSYETLAKACGGVPGAGRLHQLATKEQKTFPDPETIAGLARGCKVTPMEVIKAAARSVGLNVSDGAADSVYIRGYDQLPGKLKATIQELGEQVAELAQRAGDGDGNATPNRQAGVSPATSDSTGDNVHELFTPPPPADETAAYHAPNRGRQAKEEQDRDAEQSQDPDDHQDQ